MISSSNNLRESCVKLFFVFLSDYFLDVVFVSFVLFASSLLNLMPGIYNVVIVLCLEHDDSCLLYATLECSQTQCKTKLLFIYLFIICNVISYL